MADPRVAQRPVLAGFALVLSFAACERSSPGPSSAASAPTAPAPTAPAAEESIRPGANAQFLAEHVDLDHWVQTFEGESRDIAVARDAITAALELKPGGAVADVGSGTGLFLASLSQAVGERGEVYAVELSPAFVEHLRKRAEGEGLANVEVVPCTDHSTELAPDSIDVAFICDTYHHFEFPRSVLASLRGALRKDGAIVIVDFERIEGVSRKWVLDHVRCDKKTVIAELGAAGFALAEEVPIAGLRENYFLRFRKR